MLAMLNMLQTTLEEFSYMIVIQAVKNLTTFLSGPHEVHLPQTTQLVRDRGFADPNNLSQGTHIQLTLSEGSNNAHPAGIAEGTEEFR
jgi:hypothetical protein